MIAFGCEIYWYVKTSLWLTSHILRGINVDTCLARATVTKMAILVGVMRAMLMVMIDYRKEGKTSVMHKSGQKLKLTDRQKGC